MTQYPLTQIILDEKLQPRAKIDRTVLENYVQLLADGVEFPPVIVYRENKAAPCWLVDGFHRWHAHKVIGAETIEVDIHKGTWRDALKHSLFANAKHGLQRGATDYKRAYEIACEHGVVEDPADTERVAFLLDCSVSWAEKLTAPAREAAKAARDAEIIRLKGEGKGSREIERETGIPETTVRRISAPKEHSAEMAQPDVLPRLSEKAIETLRRLETPQAMAWSAALRALREIAEQPSVDDLFDARYTGYDRSVGPVLDAAFAWITELHRRFTDDQDQRRRA